MSLEGKSRAMGGDFSKNLLIAQQSREWAGQRGKVTQGVQTQIGRRQAMGKEMHSGVRQTWVDPALPHLSSVT